MPATHPGNPCRALLVATAPVHTDPVLRLAVESWPADVAWHGLLSHSAGARVTLAQAARATGIMHWWLSSEVEAALAALPGFDLVVALPLSLNTLAKLALGIDDAVPVRLLRAAIDAGKPVLLDLAAVPARDATALNPHFVKIYRRYADDLCVGNVAGFSGGDLAERVRRWRAARRDGERVAQTTGRQVITRDEVVAAHRAMAPLVVRRGDLVTPLARDEAAALGVPIIDG